VPFAVVILAKVANLKAANKKKGGYMHRPSLPGDHRKLQVLSQFGSIDRLARRALEFVFPVKPN
jgi:hypothetical protein